MVFCFKGFLCTLPACLALASARLALLWRSFFTVTARSRLVFRHGFCRRHLAPH